MALKQKYNEEALPQLTKELELKNTMAAPALEKVVVNTGFAKRLNQARSNDRREKIIQGICNDLTSITGQQPIVTEARKSVSSFSLRKGQPSGAKVTLRGQRMYDLLDRVINIALPRSRDFQGIPSESVDASGNLTFPIPDQTVFPEISPEDITVTFSFEITVVTDTNDREGAMRLYQLLGFPLREQEYQEE